MSRDFHSRCMLCALERHLTDQFAESDGVLRFHEFARVSHALSAFATTDELIVYLHAEAPDTARPSKDRILAELLGCVLNGQAPFARDVLLVSFVPMLHSISRQVTLRCPALSPDDIAQHVVTAFLEILASGEFQGRESHIAFAISRLLRRNTFVWAERECRACSHVLANEDNSAHVLELSPQPMERAALLHHFLARCYEQGVLSASDLELLVQFKLDDAPGTVYSNASRQRMKRLLRKLRRVAGQPNGTAAGALQLRLF